ncbi:major facilitator superfamily domain-containing protein [Suillus paluster]|uniref:major facilitator superfamily domain-containing protein n=1 Tax=Suillus paluster TaxID=48578 RepID=UPI001B881C04|nr:major facilitator superfamily domain-containing protein [Suillus paluster]KAG1753532.1 major facilitator superfamily domain-containing protein [Suillus paluster]
MNTRIPLQTPNVGSPRSSNAPQRRFFGMRNDTEEDDELSRLERSTRRASAGGQNHRRPSFVSRWRRSTDTESAIKSPMFERPPIPNALRGSESDSTPLPVLSMTVLSITMLGEFLSANVAMPFLLFMVKGFGEISDEGQIAFWTGILVSAFFLTQFLTSLLWATAAERHGRRLVLTLSLFGSAVTVLIFGTCTSLRQAIAVRLLQGIFAGAVGVARGCVAAVTDVTNEGRAYAIMGFCWGLGGVAGAIIGGSFEKPADKWPDVFGEVSLLVEYPYLLPCAVAASITFTGSFLSLFLGPDGGSREGAIRLPLEKPEDQHPTIEEEEDILTPSALDDVAQSGLVSSITRKVSSQLSGYFGSRDSITAQETPSLPVPLTASISPPIDSRHNFSSFARTNGSAYGYGGGNRTTSIASTTTLGIRRVSTASTARRRHGSAFEGPTSVTDSSDLNFAQRLLMANENAVTNIADLWVAAAMNVDNDETFEPEQDLDMNVDSEYIEHEDIPSSVTSSPVQRGRSIGRNLRSAFGNSGQRSSVVTFAQSSRMRSTPLGSPALDGTPFALRPPTIFSHPGVRTPSVVLDAQARVQESVVDNSLLPILEHRQSVTESEAPPGKPPSLTSQLPLVVIFQYGLLALHSTTHDQVFLSYLVTDYESGGLNLNPGHFSQLIALMCLAQIVYQFYLYPPPRGRFSHLAMFRLGSLLFIPAYLTVTMYRGFASSNDEGSFILMAGMIAVRYCGNTFAYTAISILLNYMTPPHAVGFANGVAQSIVSLARCFGPILGGYLWAAGTRDDPSGYPLGFLVCAGVCALAVAHSFFIR